MHHRPEVLMPDDLEGAFLVEGLPRRSHPDDALYMDEDGRLEWKSEDGRRESQQNLSQAEPWAELAELSTEGGQDWWGGGPGE